MTDFDDQKYYKTNFLIWLAIIIMMLILIGLTYLINQNNVFQPMMKSFQIKNIFFGLILIAALSVLFLKRSFFDFDKIYSKLKEKNDQVFQANYFSKFRTNYIIIWALSESIILLGFIEFILLSDFDSFKWYAIIGLYALAVNFPRKSLFEKHLSLLKEKQIN